MNFSVVLHSFSFTEKDESNRPTMCKVTKPNTVPLTGTEVVHMFVNKRDLGELEFYYLKEVDGDVYRYTVITQFTTL